jgi:6-phospho-beta-glucosidase
MMAVRRGFFVIIASQNQRLFIERGTMTKISKFTIIGGGSSYTPELIDGLIQQQTEIGIEDLVLYDIDGERQEIVCGMVERQYRYAGLPTRVTATTDLQQAVEGAEFIVSQIRVGKMPARVLDEKIPLRYNILGQETTGPGGTFKAWRTIPASLQIADAVTRYAPDAWYLNFTNPSGIVTEALLKHSSVKVIGLCDNPVNARYTIALAMGIRTEQVYLEWMGMNHVNWIRRVLVDGKDVTHQVMDMIEMKVNERLNYRFPTDIELIRALDVLPNFYLQYYYHHPRITALRQSEKQTRGEVVMELEKVLFEAYRNPNQHVKPAELGQRGGAMYSKAAIPLIISITQDRRDVQSVVTRNNRAIIDFPEDAAVEVPCVIGKHGAFPLHVGVLPQTIRGLAEHVKAWESLTVKAGVTGSRLDALAAMTANPLVPSLDTARQVLDEMMAAHAHYLPQFFSS